MANTKNPAPRTNGAEWTVYVCSVCGAYRPGANPNEFCGKCPGRVEPVRVSVVDEELSALREEAEHASELYLACAARRDDFRRALISIRDNSNDTEAVSIAEAALNG